MCVEQATQAVEVVQRLWPQVVHQARRSVDERLHRRVLGVQDAQRVAVQTAPRVFIELVSMTFQVGDQRLAVRLTLGRLAQAVDFQLDAFQPQFGPEVAGEHDQFGVHIGTDEAQRLGAELVKLAVTAALRALMAEHRPHVIQALATVVQQRMLDRRPHHTGGVFRAQGELLAVEPVLEGIHLLLDDVGHLAQAAHEQRRGFHDGRAQVAVAVAQHERAQLVFEPLPVCGHGRGDVVHAFDGAEFFCHGNAVRPGTV
ncbi:hypothetical protein Y695_03301 [Hydrogenophaga sp. T4]|nr:hypothetical protein Y695_03301 [Hydrogenophaga sp. T4]